MTSQHNPRRRHYAEELLEDYALGTLSAEDMAWMREHIESCPSCQQELAPLLAAVQALPFALPDPRVPMSDDLWDRIEQSISHSGTGAAAPTPAAPTPAAAAAPVQQDAPPDRTPANVRSLPPPPTRMMPRQWLTIAALMVLSLIGGTLLGQALPQFNTDDGVEGQQIAVEFTDPSITATGVLRYLPDQQVFVLEVDGLAPPPEGFVHQAWLIDEAGPIPAGVMDPERGEVASVGTPGQYQAFAITLEPGPLGNEAPTTEPILVASLDGDNQS